MPEGRAMNIGQASRASGVTQKMIRYYESIGLLGAVRRSANSYRVYSENDIHTLAFIRRARHLGFSIEQIGALMALWRDKGRSSAEVKAIAETHIAELHAKIGELEAMRRTLEHLVSCCRGDERPDCPIIEDLAAPRPAGANLG
jgi:Cu(I)-responsive transcriptional regulator